MTRFLYSVALTLCIPAILLRLWWRGRRERDYRRHIGERFVPSSPALPRAAIWIHAVSVGETRAALPLVEALRTRYPQRPILLTCMTPTGRRAARQWLPDDITVRYLPYDLPWSMQRLVHHLSPAALLVMETEIWPNLLAACHHAGVPHYLVNARLSEKSLARYRRFAPVHALIGEAMRHFDGVLAQSAADATRLAALGAHQATVTGNIKFDIALDAALVARGNEWRERLGPRTVLLFAITREHEELPLVQALLRAAPQREMRPLAVVVPRHPSRFAEVRQQLERLDLCVASRSQTAPAADMDIWLGDSMGEMQAYFAMCDVAIVGGSFAPLGGQNFIDAAALGRPVVVGPHTFNFAEAVRLAREADAIVESADAESAMQAALTLLTDAGRRALIGENARRFAAAHRGATARTLDCIAAGIERR